MGIENRTPQSSVRGNTPVIEDVESDATANKSEPVTQVTPKSNQVKPVKPAEPETKSNHGTVKTAEPKPEKKVMTEHEIYALNKIEQIAILKELGADEIPHYEKDRVALIVKLQ